jgi:signal transduction histidine kinase/CheY-like chemotaxis protein/HPt (histidine-containing phosphotransfer) domain-containing protein
LNANKTVPEPASLTPEEPPEYTDSISIKNAGEEARTRLMLDAIPLACSLWDRHDTFIDCNQEALRLYEMPSKQAFSSFLKRMPGYQPDGTPSTELIKEMAAAAYKDGSTTFELMYQTLSGKQLCVETTFVRVPWKNKSCLAAYARDLTQIKKTERLAQEADERTRIMLDAMPLACVFLNEQDGAIDCNAEAPRLFGAHSKQEFLERYYDYMPELQPDGLSSLAEMRRRIRLALKTGYGRSQWMHLTALGEKLPVEVIMVRVEWNGIFCIAAYIRDLRTLYKKEKEVQKAEQEILLKKRHLDIMADISKFVYWELSGEDNIVFSSQFETQFGYKTEEVRALGLLDRTIRYPPSRWIDILHPEDYERNLREIDDYYCGVTNHYRSEVRIRHKITGEYLWAVSSGIATEWKDGKPVVIIGGLFNIDDIKRTESAANAKTQFLASMSHEIRTPMNAIIGMSDLMRTDNFDEQQKEFFSDIKKMSKALLQIINDILDFSKIEAGKMHLLPVNFNLPELLNNIVSMYGFAARSKELDFEFGIDADVPSVIYGDDIRIRQIITNLLSNSIKYTRKGAVCLRVKYIRENGVNYTAFIVEDTGIGIRKEDVSKIFDTFEQLDAWQNRGISGTGLGLSITKRLVEMMNGRIDVKSEYGNGSLFTVLLPLREGDASSAGEITASACVTAKDGVNVLVVDDSAINIKVAAAYLEKHHIKADTAGNGLDAIKKTKQKRYHLIFMDHMMPGMDGLEAVRRIRALDDWYKTSPIIALTANAVSGAKEMFFENKMDDFLSKPIDVKELNRLLAKWLPPDMISKSTEETRDSVRFRAADRDSPIDKALGIHYAADDEALYTELLQDFSSAHRQDIQKIQTAMDSGDLRLARLIAHSLKSSAALIGGKTLSAAAQAAETSLSGERILSTREMDRLKAEFDAMIAQLGQIMEEQPLKGSFGASPSSEKPRAALDRTRSFALIEKLMPLLKISSTAAFDLKDDIREILTPVGEDGEALLALVADFEFEKAAVVLEKIRETLRRENP